MDRIRAFVDDFIHKEWQAVCAKFGEPNDVFVPRLRAVNALFSRDVITRSGISRSSQIDPAALRSRDADLVPRKVLDLRERDALWVCVVTDVERVGNDTPHARYYIRDDGEPRIVGYALRCGDCTRGCRRCDGGWLHADGVQLSA